MSWPASAPPSTSSPPRACPPGPCLRRKVRFSRPSTPTDTRASVTYDTCAWIDEIESPRDRARRSRSSAPITPMSSRTRGRTPTRPCCTRSASRATSCSGSTSPTGATRPTAADSTFAGRYYRAVGLPRTTRRPPRGHGRGGERLLAEHRPKVLFAGWSCYSRHLDFVRFREIADEVGAALVVDMAHFAGLVAAKVHPDPVPSRRRLHDDDAQDPRRCARWGDLVSRRARRAGSMPPSIRASRAARSRKSSPPRR